MSIASCPKCHEQVSLPAGIDRETYVRCPLCQEQYSLATVLAALPPMLIVVDPAGRETEGESIEDYALREPARIDAAPGDDERPSVWGGPTTDWTADTWTPSSPAPSSSASRESAPAFNFEAGSKPARAPSVTARPGARRKQASPIKAMVQVVGGGVLGLVIAQFFLWWMPGKWDRTNRDPLGLAATVAKYAPFLLPGELKAAEGADDPVGELPGDSSQFAFSGSSSSPHGTPAKAQARPTQAQNSSSQGIPDFPFAESTPKNTPDASDVQPASSSSAKGSEVDAVKLDPGATPASAGEPGLLANHDANRLEPAGIIVPDVSLELPDIAPPPNNPPANPSVDPPADEPTTEISSPTAVSPAIETSLAGVHSASTAFDQATEASRDEKVKLLHDLYASLARLGDAVSSAKSASPATPDAVQKAIEEFAGQPERAALVGRYAGRWLDQFGDQPGIVLYGKVLDSQPAGKFFAHRVQLATRPEREVTVVSRSPLGNDASAGNHLLILGATVADPTKALEGYEGEAQPVILHGIHEPVPTP